MEDKITFNIMTPVELNDWFQDSGSKFEGRDRDALMTMNFFLKIVENYFDDNEHLLDSYAAHVNRELH